jgi:hypothetical protein
MVNSRSNREAEAMHCLAFLEVWYSFYIIATHIPGSLNVLAGALSRDNQGLFHTLYPQAHRVPTLIPRSLLDVLVTTRPDWTSQHWTLLWSNVLEMD